MAFWPIKDQPLKMNSEFRRGAISAFPLMIGFIPLAVILGAQASQAGQSFITAYLMTALNFAGGSEFAAVGAWAIVPPVLTITISTFLINSRHVIMGANLAPYIQQESGLRVFFLYFVMCDETWALSMQDIQRRQAQHLGFSFWYHMGVGISLWLMWSWSTALGALIGNSLGDLSHYGFEMALPATFIGLAMGIRPRGRENRRQYIPIIVSFAVAALLAALDLKTYSVGGGAISGLVVAYCLQIAKEHHDKTGFKTNAQLSEGAKPLAPSALKSNQKSGQEHLNLAQTQTQATAQSQAQAQELSHSQSQAYASATSQSATNLTENAPNAMKSDPDSTAATMNDGPGQRHKITEWTTSGQTSCQDASSRIKEGKTHDCLLT